jgi:hypothetical protein
MSGDKYTFEDFAETDFEAIRSFSIRSIKGQADYRDLLSVFPQRDEARDVWKGKWQPVSALSRSHFLRWGSPCLLSSRPALPKRRIIGACVAHCPDRVRACCARHETTEPMSI